jgi:anti-sigma B factor antagonist
MQIIKRKVGDVAIFDLNGKLTIGKGDVMLRETLVEELENGCKQVLLNLDAVTTIDSSGLGELIRSKVTATSSEAEVKLIHQERAQERGVSPLFPSANKIRLTESEEVSPWPVHPCATP